MSIRLNLKKKYGQHFLEDESVIDDIMKALPENMNLPLVEVGPGGGALTTPILDFVNENNLDFKAIEIDEEKVNYLHKKFPEYKDKIVLTDFLKSDTPFEKFILMGNFPYNISSQIIFRMIEWQEKVPLMIGMFQKEVGDRLYSMPSRKSYGILSVILQTFYDTEAIRDIGPESFNPPPKVDSVVVKSIYNGNKYGINDVPKYIKFVKQGFAQRRKTLRNNYKSRFDAEELENPFYDRRAESLNIEEWVDFYKKSYADG